MTPAPLDHAIREWRNAKPRLRPDLRFHFQQERGRAVYVIEDLVNRRYHHIALREYHFIRSLDGRRPLAQLIADGAARQEDDALNEDEVSNLLRWLLEQELLEASDGAQSDRRRQEHDDRAAASKPKNRFQAMLFPKISLGSPERALVGLTRVFGWTLSTPALAGWALAILYGLWLAASHWRGLAEAGSEAILPGNWVWLIAVTLVLKLIHEAWHGIATKHFGGVVVEWGVQLIAFVTPLTYVDATSSWAFSSRWRRILVAMAGIYVELFIAVLALQVWVISEPGFVKSLAFNVVFSASAVTVLCNANPLMRFDGYYVFCDLVRIPNLAMRAQQLLKWFTAKLFLGSKNPRPKGIGQRFWLILTYGALSAMWRLVIMIGILALLSQLFHGAGVVLAITFVAGSVIALGAQIYRAVVDPATWKGAAWKVAGPRLGILAMVLLALLWFGKVDTTPRPLAVLEFAEKVIVRAETPGFITALSCQDGQRVEKGAVLLEMASPEELATLEQLQLRLEQSRQRAMAHFQGGRISSWQAEVEVATGLEERLNVQRQRVEALRVTAPRGGVVSAMDLDSRLGSFARTGDPLIHILPEEAPNVLISVAQDDFAELAKRGGLEDSPYRIVLRGRGEMLTASLRRTEKSASYELPHPALASNHGGPLVVRASHREEMASRGLAKDNGPVPEAAPSSEELVRPRFLLHAELTGVSRDLAVASKFREGEWGRCEPLTTHPVRLGAWMYESVYRFVRKQFQGTNS